MPQKKINLIDKDWNEIYQKDNSFFLHLRLIGQTRKLGSLSPKNELFIRRYKKHIFRKLDAYGFNYNLLKALPPEMKVIVREEDWTELYTHVRTIIEQGNYKYYVQEGFEMQVFLPRSLFCKKIKNGTTTTTE